MLFAIVESLSNEDTYYRIFLHRKKKWACTCPHFHYRNVQCKHIKKVKNFKYPKNKIKYSEEAKLWAQRNKKR